jgi:hypothetical protein
MLMLKGLWTVIMVWKVTVGENPARNWIRGHQSSTVQKTLTVLVLCPEILWDYEMKHGGLVYVA